MSLKEKRLAAGLTQAELSARSGVHQVKIGQIETGRIKAENLSLKNALRLADALECHPRDLI
jgi:transcriptional regulator with XRE-family HTH domain